MKAIIAGHLLATVAVVVLWVLGHQRGAYGLWTHVQGPLAALTLLRLLGWDRVRRAGLRAARSGVLSAASWYLLLAFPFFTPPSTRLVNYWSASPWESLILVPILGIAVPLSTAVSSMAIRLATRARTSPYYQILFWNVIPAGLVVVAYDTDDVWLGIPLALGWHVGLIRAFLLVEREPPNRTLHGPGR